MSTRSAHVGFTVCKPPCRPAIPGASIFLAGSIEMGKAIQWQRELEVALQHLPVTVLNPRRDDWDKSLVQDISNPHFKEQVDWEMDHLEKADIIALFLQPGTMAPISLLELGLYASHPNIVVCCPEGFQRKGNVQVVCRRRGIRLVDTTEELQAIVEQRLEKIIQQRTHRVGRSIVEGMAERVSLPLLFVLGLFYIFVSILLALPCF